MDPIGYCFRSSLRGINLLFVHENEKEKLFFGQIHFLISFFVTRYLTVSPLGPVLTLRRG